LLALLGAAQAVNLGLRLRRERHRGELLEVPLAARDPEDLAADEDLAPRALAGQAPGERARAPLQLVAARRAAAGGDERHAALDADREAELGLDVLADAVERVDERERETDRARRVVLADHRQPDDEGEALGGRRAVRVRVVLPADVGRHREEVGDSLLAARPDLVEPAELALEDEDRLRLAALRRRRRRRERERRRGGRRRGRGGLDRSRRGLGGRAPPALARHHLRDELRE